MTRSRRGGAAAALFAGLAGALCCFCVSAQQLAQRQVDELAASDFKSFMAQGSLHHAPLFHGVRGYDTSVAFEFPRRDPDFKNWADQILHGEYCSAKAVVFATDMASTVYLSSDKSTILTGTEFSIDDVLKPASGIAIDRTVTVVRPGGRVRDQGEWLRVGVGDRSNQSGYRMGREYLLFLSVDRAWSPPVFLSNPWTTAAVLAGTIHTSDDLALGIPQGQSYTVVRGRLDSLVAAHPCMAN